MIFLGYFLYRCILLILQQVGPYFVENSYYSNGYFYVESVSLIDSEFSLFSQILGRISYVSFFSCFVFFFYTFERLVKKTKYLITIVSLLLNIPFLILLPYGLAVIFFATVTFGTAMMVFNSILFYLAIKSSLEFKAISSIILISNTLAAISNTLGQISFKTAATTTSPLTSL